MARRSGLGKGLEALIPPPVRTASIDQDSVFCEIAVGSIRANARQPRKNFDDGALDSLTESVKVSGVLQPILVREVSPDSYELIAGERRWRAAQRAGLATVPAVVRSVDDMRSLEDALVENLHREDLGPVEEALAYKQLQDEFGLTQEQVAKRVGKSRPAIANTVRLLQLPADILRLVDDRRISAGHARALSGLDDVDLQRSLSEAVVDDGLSVRDLEERIREIHDQSVVVEPDELAVQSGKTGKHRADPRSAAVMEVEERLSDQLETRVKVSMGANERGRVTVEFASVSDLDRIFRTIMDGREIHD